MTTAQIIFENTKCAECEKDLTFGSIAIPVQENFTVCVECNEQVEGEWLAFQELWMSGELHADDYLKDEQKENQSR